MIISQIASKVNVERTFIVKKLSKNAKYKDLLIANIKQIRYNEIALSKY